MSADIIRAGAGENPYEICILCGKKTDIPVSMPVNRRKRFIGGCGQLCEDCYNALKLETVTANELSEEYLEVLLQMSGDTHGE